MKLKAAPGIVEIFPLFAPKTFNNGTFIEFYTIWSRLSSISSYLTTYTRMYTSLTFFIFCLDKGVHFN
jgi:hypothetical protein